VRRGEEEAGSVYGYTASGCGAGPGQGSADGGPGVGSVAPIRGGRGEGYAQSFPF